MISQFYYKEEHYVWCSPYFNTLSIPASEQTIPPSSLPGKLYKQLYDEITGGELHSDKIKRNKAGIRRGANYKERTGIITAKQRQEIYAIVSRAQILYFKPIIYVIPFPLVRDLIVEVPVNERAHPLSRECRIEKLPRSHFDIVDIHGD
jgi:hypothetical protein